VKPPVQTAARYWVLLPVDYIPELARGKSRVLIPGEDAEDDEALRQRYFGQPDARRLAAINIIIWSGHYRVRV
jgi:hypothetical protein